jgi:exonuclease SbcC
VRLDYLRAKGITCLRDINIDFTAIPPGLVAVVGPNGAGKTTFMELFTGAIFRELPTRGPAVKYATGPDSYIDAGVTFDHSGSYRARLNLDGVKSASAAVLERITDGAATRLSDGKVLSYDAAIKQVFPPLETLLASSIALQNRKGSFATRDKTARKDLFYALLGLDRLDAMATTCRAAVSLLDKRVSELRGRRDALLEHTSDELHQQLQDQAYALTADLATAEDAQKAIQRQLDAIDADIVRLRADVDAAAAVITTRARLEAQRGEHERRRTFFDEQDAELATRNGDEWRGIEERLRATLARIQRDVAALSTDAQLEEFGQRELDTIDADLSAVVNERNSRIAKNTDLVGRRAEIEAAVTAMANATAWLADIDQSIKQAHTDSREVVARISQGTAVVHRLTGLVDELMRMRRASNLLMDVPCGGDGEYAGCKLLADATAARGREAELAGERVEQALADAQATLQSERDNAAAVDRRVAQLQEQRGTARREEARQKPTADMAVYLAEADKRIAEYRADITAAETKAEQDRTRVRESIAASKASVATLRSQFEADAAKATADAELERQALDARFVDLRTKRTADREANELALQQIDAQLADTATAAAAHTAAVQALATAEASRQPLARDLTEAAAAFARVQEQCAHLHSRREAFGAAHAQRVALDEALTVLETHQIEWQALAQMLGREGLATLEIDAAGPGVSAEANDLMQASFDGRFALELVTQELKADGKGMKEVFELKVYDHERGGEARDVADLSGGEQVIVDAALRAAISLWVNRRNEQPIRTAWLDETTGALDPDNALRYVAMLRRLHERAGLHHLLFVSHSPAVSALADVQLQVADGQVRVAYPPFAPAPASQEAA